MLEKSHLPEFLECFECCQATLVVPYILAGKFDLIDLPTQLLKGWEDNLNEFAGFQIRKHQLCLLGRDFEFLRHLAIRQRTGAPAITVGVTIEKCIDRISIDIDLLPDHVDSVIEDGKTGRLFSTVNGLFHELENLNFIFFWLVRVFVSLGWSAWLRRRRTLCCQWWGRPGALNRLPELLNLFDTRLHQLHGLSHGDMFMQSSFFRRHGPVSSKSETPAQSSDNPLLQ